MDGLLINSEPYWRAANVRVLSRYEFTITEADVHKMAGLNTQSLVAHWRNIFGWDKTNDQAIINEIVADVAGQVAESGAALPGVYDLIRELSKQSIPLAVASSSPMNLIELSLRKLGIFDSFQIIRSASAEQRNKPFPDVYLSVANDLRLEPNECLVLEDSAGGVQAAKAARMTCIAVPEIPYDAGQFTTADLIVESLTKLTVHQLLSF